jgi:hypothetical protein
MANKFKLNNRLQHKAHAGVVIKIRQSTDIKRCVKSYQYLLQSKTGKKAWFWEQDLELLESKAQLVK